MTAEQLERLHRQLEGTDGTAHDIIDLRQQILGSPEVVDGTRGEVIVEPDRDTLHAFRARNDARRERDKRLRATWTQPSVTGGQI